MHLIKKKCAGVGQGQEGRAQAEDQAGRSQEEGQQRRRGGGGARQQGTMCLHQGWVMICAVQTVFTEIVMTAP